MVRGVANRPDTTPQYTRFRVVISAAPTALSPRFDTKREKESEKVLRECEKEVKHEIVGTKT